MNSMMASQYNTSRVLRLLWLNPGMSRVELAVELGLNRSTVTHIIREVADQGLVKTIGGGDAGPLGGRRKVRLAINKEYGCVAGFDLHRDLVRVAVVNLDGEVVLHRELREEVAGEQLYTGLRRSYDWVKSEVAKLGLPLLGVGCGVGGIVNPENQTIQQSIPLAIDKREPFGERLRAFIAEPVFVDNDANCCCWGEIVGKRSRAKVSFLFVFGDWRTVRKGSPYDVTSIGMGIVINDLVHLGKDFSAGEFRSIQWRPGNVSQFSLSDEQISAARKDRPLFLVMVRELARNTAFLVNALDLDRLYLGGFFESTDAEEKEIFTEEIRRNWSYPNKPACEVVFSTFGRNAVAVGAASMFLERMFGLSAHLVLTGRKAGIDLLTG